MPACPPALGPVIVSVCLASAATVSADPQECPDWRGRLWRLDDRLSCSFRPTHHRRCNTQAKCHPVRPAAARAWCARPPGQLPRCGLAFPSRSTRPHFFWPAVDAQPHLTATSSSPRWKPTASASFAVPRAKARPRPPKYSRIISHPGCIAFYLPGPDARWVYVANSTSVVRFPYRSGDLKARAPAESWSQPAVRRTRHTRPRLLAGRRADVRFSWFGKQRGRGNAAQVRV